MMINICICITIIIDNRSYLIQKYIIFVDTHTHTNTIQIKTQKLKQKRTITIYRSSLVVTLIAIKLINHHLIIARTILKY